MIHVRFPVYLFFVLMQTLIFSGHLFLFKKNEFYRENEKNWQKLAIIFHLTIIKIIFLQRHVVVPCFKLPIFFYFILYPDTMKINCMYCRFLSILIVLSIWLNMQSIAVTDDDIHDVDGLQIHADLMLWQFLLLK